MANFGIDQISSVPPKWWRQIERALLIGVLPATTAFVTQVVVNTEKEIMYLTAISFVAALVKSVGLFLGSGEKYPEETPKESDLHPTNQ